ncbi:MAG: sulfatase [bacterium]|nr:sulfatase [bacterium]
MGQLPVRLDGQAGEQAIRAVRLGSEVRPTLPPGASSIVYPLADAPNAPTLWVGLGLEPKGDAARWRAEVRIERDGVPPATFLSESIATSGAWRDLRLPLEPTISQDARLVLYATLEEASGDSPRRLLWGDPVLLPEQPLARPSVILVSLDTLRADHVGSRLKGRSRTPRLDAFAAEAVRYTHAYSPSHWTLPSHVSLLWGRHPGVLDRVKAADGLAPPDVLGPVASLAERFADEGYLTGAMTGGGWMSNTLGLGPWHPFSRGFDVFKSFEVPHQKAGECDPRRFDGDTVFGWAEEWVRTQAEHPYFLFVHTYEAHDRCPFFPPGDDAGLVWRYDAERQPKLLAYYDELVERTDALFGRLLDAVAASGQADRTIIAVTSDHGEAFFEHGAGGHGCGIRGYDELTRVPLIVRPAKDTAAPAIVAAPVSVVQMAPTLTALAGIADGPPFDEPPLPGLDIRGGRAPDAVVVQCEDQLAVRSGSYKLLSDRRRRRPDQLYDLAADPGETVDIATRPGTVHPTLAAVAEAYWATLDGAAGIVRPSDVDAETRKQLHALGYVE